MFKTKQYYQDKIKKHEIKEDYIKNTASAFFFGGLICVIGQIFIYLYENVCNFNEKDARSMMYLTLIFLATLLSGLGVYDKIGQIAKAGTIVPITGFANSVSSSAIEYRSEGVFLGIATNTLKLAGSVITFGVVSALVVGVIRYLGEVLF